MIWRDWLNIAIVLVTIIGIALGRLPAFRMNRATLALVGSAALILLNAISLEDAYRAIDMNTLVLLFSMMIINANLRLSGFFKILVNRIVSFAHSPLRLLILVVFSSGFLSGLFLNDTIVLIFTPILLELTLALRRNPMPYLLGLATGANAGSAATIVGNPQNMIIGTASKIPFLQFALYCSVPAVLGIIAIIIVIRILYRGEFSDTRLPEFVESDNRVYKPLLIKSSIALCLLIAAFFFNVPVTLAAFGAAAILLFTRRIKPERVFAEIDWSLLVFFAALFVVTEVLGKYVLAYATFTLNTKATFAGLTQFTFVSAVLSNLISNVPAVLVLSPFIKAMADAQMHWLMLALASTFAGNLTLLGSVANLIVAESAKRRGVILSFNEYLRAGLPITLITLALGVAWMWLLFS